MVMTTLLVTVSVLSVISFYEGFTTIKRIKKGMKELKQKHR